jgi:DNA helicase-2/ATP-dependent DNA helicase PcrA
MRAVICTGKRGGRVITNSLTGPIESSDPVSYRVEVNNYNDLFKLYHHALYPHYLSNIPAVYYIENPEQFFRRISTISDPLPVGCPLTAKKIVLYLSRLKRVDNALDWSLPPNTRTEIKYNTGLDPEQSRAATHYLGPAMVIAPAGSGKTSTLIARIIYLIKMGIDPARIICLTFTKKAQKEMQERLIAKLGEKAKDVMVRTFHSLAYSLTSKLIGEPKIITERYSILKTLISGNLDEVDKYITYNLNNLVPPLDVKSEYQEVYIKYIDYLNKNGITDQDYLLFQLCNILREKVVLGHWQFVLIDECQDNNLAQDVIARFISPLDNTFWVGDPDQLLYSFRGSDIKRILNLRDIYPNLKEIYLKRNYRCHPEIVTAAVSLIGHNTLRYPIEITPARTEDGRAVFLNLFDGILEEYEWVGQKINALLQSGTDPEHIAVLYRNNSQGEALASVGLKDIPHYIYKNGVLLFESTEMDTLLNCLSRAQKGEPMEIGRVTTGLFVDLNLLPNTGMAIAYLRKKLGLNYLDPDRLDIIEKIAGRFKNINEFLSWVSKVKFKKKEDDKGKIRLLTVHSAKGLEFPIVFLINSTEGHFPSRKSTRPEEIEEERRIFYVGMTRAREKLYMSGYRDKDRKLSGFITEALKAEALKTEKWQIPHARCN